MYNFSETKTFETAMLASVKGKIQVIFPEYKEWKKKEEHNSSV